MPAPPADERRILIGTSGYSFADWVGPFYPSGTRSGDFLPFYARHFDAVEVNSTYYRIPHPRVIEQMERKTPPGFHFVVKLNQAMTHEGARDPDLYREFLAAIEPLKAAGKYDGLLAQFPWAFKRTPASLAHLDAMRGHLAGEPLFVEFRHASWNDPATAPWLRERGLGFCAVDEPALEGLMPPVIMVTSEDAYVRFHGRNAANWWGGSGRMMGGAAPVPPPPPAPSAQGGLFAADAPPAPRRAAGDRYDYDYSERELREWLGRIQELAQQARRTYLFFNNCHAGQAARNAKLMQALMRQQKLPA
ncbi:MAG TPA: DUF72 domain-containing protein [Candidatus Eisenbacteria bacterium]